MAPGFLPEVGGVRSKENQSTPGLCGESHETKSDLSSEDHEEPALIPAKVLMIDVKKCRSPSGSACEERPAHHGVRNRSKDQRPAQRGPDADLLLGWGFPEDHGNKGHHAFGKRGAEGGKDRSRCLLAEIESVAGPLHAVYEVFAGQIDQNGRAEEEGQGTEKRCHGVRLGSGSADHWRNVPPDPVPDIPAKGLAKPTGRMRHGREGQVCCRTLLCPEDGYSPMT